MTDERASDAIDRLAEEYWDGIKAAEPTTAHLLGDTSRAGEFEDVTRAHEDAWIASLRGWAARAESIEAGPLTDDQRTTRGALISDATGRADMTEARFTEFAADPIFGPQESAPIVFGMFNVPDATVADAMVEKLGGFARSVRDLCDRHREGIASGRVSAAFAVTGSVEQIDRLLATPVADDPILGAIHAADGVDTPAWRERLAAAIEEQVRPAFAAYRDVLRDEVLPHARPDDRAGLCHLPDGEDAYARTLRFYTTTGRSAQEIHELGLVKVAELADEYRALGATALGTGDLDEIFTAMRTDPALHFASGEEMVRASEVAMERAWQAMDGWFEVLPQAPCAVQGTLSGPKAYYFPPAADGSRGGTFFINTDEPETWGTFELEAMAFHEGIPGHHLQLAIAAELPASVPEFRKFAETAAYAEGWGLYSERLADEMGLYTTDIDRLGMLSADSMRACRLVVDTGLHSLGWTRRQAIDYMVANSPLTEGVCRPEVDRYLVTPGQATSYMVGRVEILRLREEARRRQGDAFDLKAFHSAVLDSGTLPLDVLDQVVSRRLG